MLKNPNIRQLHCFHLYNEYGNTLGATRKEGEFNYNVATQEISVSMMGNPTKYQHKLPFTQQRYSYHYAGYYINLVPLETTNLIDSVYGLFELVISDAPKNIINNMEVKNCKTNYEVLINKLDVVDIRHYGFTKEDKGIYKYLNTETNKYEFLVVDDVSSIFTSTNKIVVPLDKLLELIKTISQIILNKGNNENITALLNSAIINACNAKNMNINATESIIQLAYKHVDKLANTLHKSITRTKIDEIYVKLNTQKTSWREWLYQYKYKLLFGITSMIGATSLIRKFGILQWLISKVFSPCFKNIIRMMFTGKFKFITLFIFSTLLCGTAWKCRNQLTAYRKNNIIATVAKKEEEKQLIGDSCIDRIKPIKYNGTTKIQVHKPDGSGLISHTNVEDQELKDITCTCANNNKKRYLRVLNPNVDLINHAVLYKPCFKNNVAALLRMATKVPKPDPELLQYLKKIHSSFNYHRN